jgi:hypothetical protein
MEHGLENTLALLARTPAVLDAQLRGLPAFWVDRNEGSNSWTAAEVVGHLAYADRVNWMPRVRRILEFGEDRAFDSFDRNGHLRECEGRSLDALLDEFASLRRENLAALRALHLAPAQLENRGRHPALGTVTLAQLLAAWAAHDLTHLHQIVRVLAFQYGQAVGPWRRFLGVLHCNGHSLPA